MDTDRPLRSQDAPVGTDRARRARRGGHHHPPQQAGGAHRAHGRRRARRGRAPQCRQRAAARRRVAARSAWTGAPCATRAGVERHRLRARQLGGAGRLLRGRAGRLFAGRLALAGRRPGLRARALASGNGQHPVARAARRAHHAGGAGRQLGAAGRGGPAVAAAARRRPPLDPARRRLGPERLRRLLPGHRPAAAPAAGHQGQAAGRDRAPHRRAVCTNLTRSPESRDESLRDPLHLPEVLRVEGPHRRGQSARWCPATTRRCCSPTPA